LLLDDEKLKEERLSAKKISEKLKGNFIENRVNYN
jgi:hypothetical protein